MTDFNDFVVAAATAAASVSVPGVIDGATATKKFTVTSAAQAILDDATLAAILATLGPVNANAFWEICEEFHGGNAASSALGTHGARYTGTAVGIAPEAAHPGIARLTPTAGGAATVEFLAISGAGGNTGSFVYDDCDGWSAVCRFNATANGDHRFGIMNGAISSAATSGIYLEHLAADTNWFACIRKDASNITRVDTGVAFGTGWIKAKAERGATSWIFTVGNNAPMAEMSATNIPTGTLAATIGVQQVKGSTAQPTIDVDMLSAWGAIAR